MASHYPSDKAQSPLRGLQGTYDLASYGTTQLHSGHSNASVGSSHSPPAHPT